MPGGHGHAPSGHIVRFTERIELDGNIFGSFDAQDACAAFVENEAVRIVVNYYDVVFLAEIDNSP